MGGYAFERVRDKVEAEGEGVYLSKRRKSYHNNRRALRGQVVGQWNIETSEYEETFSKFVVKCMEHHGLVMEFERSSGTEIGKRNSEVLEHSRNLHMT